MKRGSSSSSSAVIVFIIIALAVSAVLKYWYIAAALLLVGIIVYMIRSNKQKKAREAYLSLPVLYIGNKQTRTYHVPTCRTLVNLDRSHTVAFRTRDEPAAAGYRPCGTCKPN